MGQCKAIPGCEEAAQVLQDLLAIQIGLPANWCRGGTTRCDQGHQPIHIDIHAQSYRVVVQWKGQTKVQHLHRPCDLPQTASQELALAVMSHSAKGEGKGMLPASTRRGAVYPKRTHLPVCLQQTAAALGSFEWPHHCSSNLAAN